MCKPCNINWELLQAAETENLRESFFLVAWMNDIVLPIKDFRTEETKSETCSRRN